MMKKLMSILLNTAFTFAIYAAGVGMQYGDNLLNVMTTAYFLFTLLMVVCGGLVYFAVCNQGLDPNDETIAQFEKLNDSLKITWISKLFYATALPLCAWFGFTGVATLIILALIVTLMLKCLVKGVLAALKDIENKA